jgi:hypothetical protein
MGYFLAYAMRLRDGLFLGTHQAEAAGLVRRSGGEDLMRLVDEWRWLLRSAWSVRFNIIAAGFAAVTATIGVLTAYQVELPVGPITLAIVCGIATLGASLAALAARFVKQARPDQDVSERLQNQDVSE